MVAYPGPPLVSTSMPPKFCKVKMVVMMIRSLNWPNNRGRSTLRTRRQVLAPSIMEASMTSMEMFCRPA